MKIDDVLIKRLETLSRMSLTAEEKADAKAQLEKIIGYFGKIDALDLSDDGDGSMQGDNVFRRDAVHTSAPLDAILKNAPAAKDGYFKVPKTLE